jgi:hypothetical protein
MRSFTIGFALLLGPGLAFFACSSQDPDSQTTSSSGAGGAPNCDDVVIVYGLDAGNTCDVCLHKECCALVASCTDKACLDCVNYGVGNCATNANANALNKCIFTVCHDPCHINSTAFTSSGTGSGMGSSASSG